MLLALPALAQSSAGRIVPLVAHLVQDREFTDAELCELRQLIDAAERAHRKAKSKAKPAQSKVAKAAGGAIKNTPSIGALFGKQTSTAAK